MVSMGSNLIGNLGKITNDYLNKTATAESTETSGFKQALNDAMERFEQVGNEDAQSTFELLAGKTDDLSTTMIAAQKSELAISFTVAVRNKAVESYKEIMNMQV